MSRSFAAFKKRFRLHVWRLAHGIGAYVALILIYAAVAGTLVYYFHRRSLFKGIESWPSVPAHAVVSKRFPGPPLFGGEPDKTASAITTVKYTYVVDGAVHKGCRASPDSPVNEGYFGESPRAYYNPHHPEIAVLFPVPYQGTGLIVALTIGAIAVVAHLCFMLLRRA